MIVVKIYFVFLQNVTLILQENDYFSYIFAS